MRISLARRHWFSSVVAAASMVVGAAVVQVATAGPAAALPGGGGWEVKTGDSGSGTATFKTSFTFDCPSGKKAFGAGGRIDTGNGTVGLVMIRPDDALSKGRASTRRTGSGPDSAWSVTSYVVCAFPVPGQQYTGKITPNSSTSLVTCPGSTKTNGIGGGGGLVDLGAVFLQTMAPNGDRGVAVEMTGVQNGGAMVQATCSD